jgi:uncharacterized membrane protein YbhN (UPF0104 family)
MQKASLMKIGKRVLQVVLPVAILGFLFYYSRNDWAELASAQLHLNWWLLALSFLGFLLQELSYGLIWRSVLQRLGYNLDLRPSLRIYLGSEFVRYIPGNVWHVLTRILWVGKYGVPRPIALASMIVELTTKLAAGALVFALSLLFWGDIGVVGKLLNGTPVIAFVGVLTIVALLVVLHPRVLSSLLNFALRLLKREPVVLTLRYRNILTVTLYWCISWLIAGCAFYVLLLSLWPTAPLLLLPIGVGIYAIVWDIGFLSFVTPSGLGARELSMVGLFALVLPSLGFAPLLAVLSRVVSTLAELLCVSVAYFSGGRPAQEIQQEQRERIASTKAVAEQQDAEVTSTSDTFPGAAVAGVEEGASK